MQSAGACLWILAKPEIKLYDRVNSKVDCFKLNHTSQTLLEQT